MDDTFDHGASAAVTLSHFMALHASFKCPVLVLALSTGNILAGAPEPNGSRAAEPKER
jgi:hypothetical protein